MRDANLACTHAQGREATRTSATIKKEAIGFLFLLPFLARACVCLRSRVVLRPVWHLLGSFLLGCAACGMSGWCAFCLLCAQPPAARTHERRSSERPHLPTETAPGVSQLAGACARVDADESDIINARRRRRRGPTGSSVQAVTEACCAVNAGAGAGAAREEGEEGAAFARFYCPDLGRAALQPGTDTPWPSL